MKSSFRTGLSFGLTSGVITTLGLIVGLYSGTHLKMAVVGGILTIAVADAFSDALGIHVSEESERKKEKSVWESTITTFFAKFVIALSFIIPVLLFDLGAAVIVSIVWGFLLLGWLSFKVARTRGEKPWKAVFEHLGIGIVVVIVTYFVGKFVGRVFG